MTIWPRRTLLVVLLGTAIPAVAGVELVELEKTQVAHTLSGIVRDGSGVPVQGATVAEVSQDHMTVIRTRMTDKNGSFTFSLERKRKIYHLMISCDGFNPMLVHVKTSRWTRKLLDLRLELAT